jgi:glycyl-tRNA synthetase
VKKDGLPELAKKIMRDLSLDFNCYYEEKDSIGKRYRRQDAIGTPICITVDHDSVNDQAVTIRYRDTMNQMRVSLSELHETIEKEVSMKALLKGLI